jgi:uncharacterized membrane protein
MSEIKKRVSADVFAPNRLEILTDGVFAIVMTLLVLEITLPEIASPSLLADLPRKLLELGPKLYKYTISFVVLGILFSYHHRAFNYIKRSNMALVWLNIVFLMFVALIPFSTAIQGEIGQIPEQTSSFIYTQDIYILNITLAVAMILIIWTYATGKHRLVDSDISPRLVKVYKLILIGFLLFFMLVIGISFIEVGLASLLMVIPLVAAIVMQLRMPGRLYQ